MSVLGGIKNWLVGGDASRNLPTQGANYGTLSGYLQQGLAGSGGRPAPTAQQAQLGPAAQLNGAQSDQSRSQLMALAGNLGSIASGQTAGAGELAVNRQVGQAQAAQQAMARMARGANAALAARQAARSTADLGVSGAGAAAQAQLQDQANANGQLQQLLSGVRGQDIDVANANAGYQQQTGLQQGQFGQQTNLANLQAQLAQTGMNDQQIQSYLAQLLGLDQQTLQNQYTQAGMSMQDQGHLASLIQAGAGIAGAFAGRPK